MDTRSLNGTQGNAIDAAGSGSRISFYCCRTQLAYCPQSPRERSAVGSIRRAPRSGRWEARYRDPVGRQRSQTFDRKADAQTYLAAAATDARRGEWLDPALARVIFDDFVSKVFVPTLNGLEPSSR